MNNSYEPEWAYKDFLKVSARLNILHEEDGDGEECGGIQERGVPYIRYCDEVDKVSVHYDMLDRY